MVNLFTCEFLIECPKGHWKAVLYSDREHSGSAAETWASANAWTVMLHRALLLFSARPVFYLFNQEENIGQLIHNFLNVLFLFSF